MRQNNPFTGGGKGYVMNGAFKQGGSPNSISFSTMVDPTPHPSEDFGTSSAGIGDVFGDSRNELLIGAYGPHNPGTATDTINDVHIFDPIHEVSLLDIQAPDQQPGLGFGTSLAPLGDLNGDGFLISRSERACSTRRTPAAAARHHPHFARTPAGSTSSGATTLRLRLRLRKLLPRSRQAAGSVSWRARAR